MAEEHPCQAPEGHILCVNNCGFFGSPTTMNLCSKCFREQESTKSTIKTALSTSSATTVPSQPPQSTTAETSSPLPVELSSISLIVATNPGAAPVQSNRCAECRKRVGLTGFKCRCGVTFCGTHRYPEKHACTFDFKTVGRDEIARANPVIKAEKLERI